MACRTDWWSWLGFRWGVVVDEAAVDSGCGGGGRWPAPAFFWVVWFGVWGYVGVSRVMGGCGGFAVRVEVCAG